MARALENRSVVLSIFDRLTDEEYDVIRTHPEVGWRMLAGHPLAELAEAAVRAHHETPDGKGYPRGLAGEQVPVDARIVGICDAFDAMTSTRAYRAGMPIEKALTLLQKDAEKGQLDPVIVSILADIVNRDGLLWQSAEAA